MKHSAIKPNLALITISGLMLSSQAYSIETPIYKWQDNRGITQYSDRAPNVAYTKATRFEMINALQAKDLCTAPSTGSSVYLPKVNLATNTTPAYSANFFGGINNPIAIAARAARAEAARATKAAKAAAKRAAAAAKSAAKRAAAATKAAANSIGGSSLGSSAFGPSSGSSAQAAAAQAAAAQAAAAQAAAAQAAAAQAAAAQAAAAQAAAAQAAAAQAAAAQENSNIVQKELMPAVDISKNIVPKIGYDKLRVATTTEIPTPSGGEFRISCTPSHMSNDDPIVYPNQPGAAHHHTFFGNTSVNAKSNLMTLSSTGNSTCSGGIMNRSAYWFPSVIDTATNKPIAPDFSIFYYKANFIAGELIQPPPKGLRMIAGNSKGTTAANSKSMFTCIPPNDKISRPFYGWSRSIPACPVNWEMDMSIGFPQCWDGVNLDSPDHISHMAPADTSISPYRCPATHPVPIPSIALNMRFKVVEGMDLSKWRLSSDNYSTTLPGGYSAHTDWVNGWDEEFMKGIIKNCLNKKQDCHAHLLGDGRMFY